MGLQTEKSKTPRAARGTKKTAEETPAAKGATIEADSTVISETEEPQAIVLLTALTAPSDLTEAEALAFLEKRYAGIVVDVSTALGEAAARKSRKELVSIINRGDEKRLELNRADMVPINARNATYKKIEALALKYKAPLDTAIKEKEAAELLVKQEKARVNQERIDAIRLRITGLLNLPLNFINASAEVIKAAVGKVGGVVIGEDFAEFAEEAKVAQANVVEQLNKMLVDKEASEAEAARLESEQKESERKQVHQQGIDRINRIPEGVTLDTTLAELVDIQTAAQLIQIDHMEEYQDAAKEAIDAALVRITNAIDQKRQAIKLADDQIAFEETQRRAELDRNAAESLRNKIAYISSIPFNAFNEGHTSVQIAQTIEEVDATECAGEASLVIAVDHALNGLKTLLKTVQEQERVAAELKARQEELSRQEREAELAELEKEEARVSAELALAEEQERLANAAREAEEVEAARVLAEAAREAEAQRAAAEEQRLNELTMDFRTTLQAILDAASNTALSDADARAAIADLATRGLGREAA